MGLRTFIVQVLALAWLLDATPAFAQNQRKQNRKQQPATVEKQQPAKEPRQGPKADASPDEMLYDGYVSLMERFGANSYIVPKRDAWKLWTALGACLLFSGLGVYFWSRRRVELPQDIEFEQEGSVHRTMMEAKKRLETSDDKSIPPAPFLGPAVTKPEPKYRQEGGPEARADDRADEIPAEREPAHVTQREPAHVTQREPVRVEESPNLATEETQALQALPDLAPPPPPPPPRMEHAATINPVPPPPPAYAPPAYAPTATPPRVTPALESLGHSFSETPVLEPILDVFSDHGTPLTPESDEPTSISVSRREISESLHLYAEVASDFDSWRRQGVDAYENLLDTYGLTFSTWRDIALEWRRKFDRDEDLRSRYESLKTEIQKRKSPRQVS